MSHSLTRTQVQRKMMGKAWRFHGIRSGIVTTFLVIATVFGVAIRNQILEDRARTAAKNVEEQNRIQAVGLVNALLTAETSRVPGIILAIDKGQYRRWADVILKAALESEEDSSPAKLHASMALLPVDETQVDYLVNQLLALKLNDLSTVRDALIPHKEQVVGPLWNVLNDETEESNRRFRAACALAAYTRARGPHEDIFTRAFRAAQAIRKNEQRWHRENKQHRAGHSALPFVARHMVMSLNISRRDFDLVVKVLEPWAKELVKPLSDILRDNTRRESERDMALSIYLEYAFDNPNLLAAVLTDGDDRQFAAVLSHAERLSDEVGENSLLHKLANRLEVLARSRFLAKAGNLSEKEKESIAKRKAAIAVALLKFGRSHMVWPLLKQSPDNRTRTYIIHWAAPRGVDPSIFVARYDDEPDVSIRQALLLALGEFSETQLTIPKSELLVKKLMSVYETDPDPGLHGCAEWLLRKRGHVELIKELTQKLMTSEELLAKQTKESQRRWYVTTQGHTMAVLEADTFRMGSLKSEPGRENEETPHLRKIGRTFAIAAHEVTREQFRRFEWENPDISTFNIDQYSLTDDSPQVGVDWYDAAAYCNWLSKKEGIPEDQWCYEKNTNGRYAAGMKAKETYQELTGYRLPTEAEWEYACRAGTVTSRHYGLTVTLLPKYARYEDNGKSHTWPVGGLKPNGFGLFDMLGNAIEWCHDGEYDYDRVPRHATAANADVRPVSDARDRMLRGGSFDDLPIYVRSAYRVRGLPWLRSRILGFRPTRTYPSVP